ncbi:TlpA family protein disulfide reductase [Fodinibius salsisoli]|uniref:Uncharacterized protein n=1 Tax=Fodinibius salsisoli TaxID=2820877 RepID=A0ABT3PMR6_9BACT|nr:hypothetical protein [Fodinibius salsisoli]MCW9707155.1 hypothetical protein [Fodinibius salsisoli]
MRLDPKYFNTFLAVVAVIAALAIIYLTINTQQDKRRAFNKQMMQQDLLQTVGWKRVGQPDSLRISSFDSSFVLLQFWSNWSDTSAEEHQKLSTLKEEAGSKLAIFSAIVGLQKEEATTYIEEHNYPFHYVAGSRQFSSFQVPGLPAYLLFQPGGKVRFVSLGSLEKTHLDSLKTMIHRGSK